VFYTVEHEIRIRIADTFCEYYLVAWCFYWTRARNIGNNTNNSIRVATGKFYNLLYKYNTCFLKCTSFSGWASKKI